MNKTRSELLPCPFCGGGAETMTDDYGSYWASCECGISISEYGVESVEQAIKVWNTRIPTVNSYPEMKEALELLLEAKHIKDKFGKGIAYEQLKARGWEAAKKALSKTEGHDE